MKRSKQRRDAGLTLVELMVTIVVASLVATSTFMFFMGQQRIYETQTKLLNVQQNVWAAMETVTRYVRASGTGMLGCVARDPTPTASPHGPDYGAPPPVGPPDFPLGAPQTGLRIYYKPLNTTIRVPPLWISNGTTADPGAPDTLTVAFGDGTFGNFADTNTIAQLRRNMSTTDPVQVPGGGVENIFRAGEFIVVLDNERVTTPNHVGFTPHDRGCTTFMVSGVTVNPGPPAVTTINHSAAAPYDRWNPPSDQLDGKHIPWDYSFNADVTQSNTGVRNFGRLRWIRFYIRPPAPGVPPALMMRRYDDAAGTDQVLAEGIEDMQIAYACDNIKVNDGVLQEGLTTAEKRDDEWVFNVTGELFGAVPPPMCNKPDAIRITLVARSVTEDSTLESFSKATSPQKNLKPTVEDATVSTIPTMFRYRTISTTVFPRN